MFTSFGSAPTLTASAWSLAPALMARNCHSMPDLVQSLPKCFAISTSTSTIQPAHHVQVCKGKEMYMYKYRYAVLVATASVDSNSLVVANCHRHTHCEAKTPQAVLSSRLRHINESNKEDTICHRTNIVNPSLTIFCFGLGWTALCNFVNTD